MEQHKSTKPKNDINYNGTSLQISSICICVSRFRPNEEILEEKVVLYPFDTRTTHQAHPPQEGVDVREEGDREGGISSGEGKGRGLAQIYGGINQGQGERACRSRRDITWWVVCIECAWWVLGVVVASNRRYVWTKLTLFWSKANSENNHRKIRGDMLESRTISLSSPHIVIDFAYT